MQFLSFLNLLSFH